MEYLPFTMTVILIRSLFVVFALTLPMNAGAQSQTPFRLSILEGSNGVVTIDTSGAGTLPGFISRGQCS